MNTACMETLTRKQQEIRQREQQILSTAGPLIRAGGLAGFSMDAVAKKMRYTRGTIYNHFPNKEDIVLSLAARAVQRRVDLFEFAIGLATKSRQRIAAIGIACEVYADALPDDFAVEQMVRHDSVWEKTSSSRQDLLTRCEGQCMQIVDGVLNDAVNCGDLPMTRNHSTADICFGLWSLIYGGLVLEQTSPSLSLMGIQDSRKAIRRNCNAMLDGLNWQSPYDATSYNRFVKRITPRLADQCRLLTDTDSESNQP